MDRVIAYFNQELSEKERIELLREAAVNPELQKTFAGVQNSLAILSFSPEAIDTQAGKQALHRLMQRRNKKRWIRYSLRAVASAAAIALLVIVTRAVVLSTVSPAETQLTAQQELYVPAGQRARLTLPDGSTVWLNAGSTLLYPSAFGKERNVCLKGEGFFDVAKNPDKPFIVSTDSIDIVALGTQFNVYSYAKAGYVNTTLIEGSVKVFRPGEKTGGTLLQPNQQAIYKNGKFSVKTSADTDKLMWKEGIYTFREENLDTIIKDLELYYDVKIIVRNPKILQYRYTGKFRQRDGVMEILRIIQKIHGFKIYKDENQNIITLS
ncbi:hypothetical protein AGMMS50239_08650 [Bacteroidia bacterium]|nr:hypothetical protein AGMMS50239_08650 [Bacteroidia bacterium]